MFPIDATANQDSHFYVYRATDSDPDTMYHHDAMRELDQVEFVQANKWMMGTSNWYIDWRSLPAHASSQPCDKCNTSGTSKEVKKLKASLNFDGSKMK